MTDFQDTQPLCVNFDDSRLRLRMDVVSGQEVTEGEEALAAWEAEMARLQTMWRAD